MTGAIVSRTKKNRPLVGLDIEPGGIAAVQVGLDGGLTVARGANAALAPNVVRDGEVQDVEALSEALRTLFADHDLDRRVRIGVANQRIVVRTIDLPPIEGRKELEAAVRFTAQDELPMPLDEAVIDFHVLGIHETEAGPRQRVLLVAARREMIERVLLAARAAGLRPEGIDLAAFAMVRAVVAEGDEPTLYLAIGGLTNLAIATGPDVLFTRVSGSGMEGMASLLAERRGMPIEEARALLIEAGVDGEIEPGAEEETFAARAVLGDAIRRIAGEARASVDFHQASGDADGPVTRAVVTGPVVAIPGFVDALSAELGIPATAGAVPSEGGDGARYAIAAGLAIEELAA